MTLDLVAHTRLVLDARLRPVVGSAFQPTGFANLGPAEFTRPGGQPALLVESVQSMTNRLEDVGIEPGTRLPVELLRTLPWIAVRDPSGRLLTSSRLEPHRLASAYVREAVLDGVAGVDWLVARLGLKPKTPLDMPAIYRAVFELDPLCLVHGVFFSDKKFSGNPKVRRAVTAVIEAHGVSPVVSGGLKRDDVQFTASAGAGAEEGYGFVPFGRTEYVADEIVLSAAVDLHQIRGYGLGDAETRLLELLAVWELARCSTGRCGCGPRATSSWSRRASVDPAGSRCPPRTTWRRRSPTCSPVSRSSPRGSAPRPGPRRDEPVVCLKIRFDLGRFHATPWGTHVNEATVEWPPSPWRIMRALLAASHARADLIAERATLLDALRRLAAAPPPAYALPATFPAHTRHFYPLGGWSPTSSGLTSLVVDAFLAIDPAAELDVCWDADLEPPERAALARAADGVGYLGRSESVCTISVTDRATSTPNAVPAAARPDWSARARHVELWSVEPGSLAALEVSIADMRKARRLVPAGVQRIAYDVLDPASTPVVEAGSIGHPTLAHLRMRGAARPPLVDAVEVARVLRAALQRRYHAAVGGGVSRVFSGHGADGSHRRDQHRHAHYLVGSDRDARRVDHLWVWAPEGFGDDELAAIAALRELRFRDAPEPCRVGLAALGDERGLLIPRLTGPSVAWRSVTPFVLPRHEKRRAGRVVDGPAAQIARELAYRGFPEPVAIALVPGPWATFKLTRPGVARHSAARAVGAVIRFDQPVHGPIAIGAQSHFGLGRFEPQS